MTGLLLTTSTVGMCMSGLASVGYTLARLALAARKETAPMRRDYQPA